MTKKELKEVEIVNLSVKEAKKYIRRFFAWAHRGLTWLEDWVLRRIDKLGKKAEEKITERTE